MAAAMPVLPQGSVAVLMGGTASERDISLQSGAAVLEALTDAGMDCVGVDTAEDLVARLGELKPAFAFIAVHGAGGEDGRLQALLEFMRIPYSGSGVLASALAMDKLRSKQLWRGIGLTTPDYCVFDANEASDSAYFERTMTLLGNRVFVKPVAEGSSFGMSLVHSADELRIACNAAEKFGQTVMIERAIVGPEYTVAILGERCLPSIGIETGRGFYDFDAKYIDDSTRFLVPSGLEPADEQRLRKLCKTAFDALGCAGWGRVDVMRCADSGDFYLLEVNTVPGMTDHSLVPMAARAEGLEFADLLKSIIAAGMLASEVGA
ncbi:MAG: D-alanine--D-alanine ligase [Gammaproteobacteria bacterium]|nr:D-alanine--D-alanine ligase [Gammaproteobacteria bacterium]NND39078.1 D-alanine--D-alanine ligase [Pseudomonadales bacterium]NNM11670.1 D-alanine--D-alanine ligase [Pseudomonadales bacterium]RZV57960.1 MAG: D-alanine--D-alanine ligase [Pseudomonadales bacterium]